MTSRALPFLAAAAALALLTACGGPPAGDAPSTVGDPGSAAASSATYRLPTVDVAAAVADLPAVEVLPEVRQHLDAYVAGCHFEVEDGFMNRCPSEATRPFETWMRENKSTAAFESLAELAVAGESAEMRIAASTLLESFRSKVQYQWLDENASEAMALRAVHLLRDATTPPAASRAALAAVQLGWATGLQSLVIRAIHDHEQKMAKTTGFDQMVRFGRLEGFRYMRWEAEQDDALVREVLGAVQGSGGLEPDEKAEICPWAEGFLAAEDSYRALDAAKVLLDCGTEYVPTILEDGERRLAAGAIDGVLVNIYREPCFVYRDQPDAAQCEAVYAFLEKIGNAETLASDVRGTALWNIYYQRRTEETAVLLDRYADHPDEVIRGKVQSAIDSIRG